MTLQYEDIQCPIIEKSIRKGAVFEISECLGNTLSRVESANKLLASQEADNIYLLLQKTEWQLQPDKLKYQPPFRRTFKGSSLDEFIKNGGKIKVKFKNYLGFEGILIYANGSIVATRYLTHLSNLLSSLEIDAIQYV